MQEIINESESYLIHSYNRYPVVLDHGEGVYLYDTDGKKYIDFGSGIAVCAFGYSDEELKQALKDQIDKVVHVSNYFYSEPLRDAAKGLARITGMDVVFMANSGTEANEGALKLARKYALMKGYTDRSGIISMEKGFHGRSMGALSVTGTKKYREAYEPLISGVSFADYNDLKSVEEKITDRTYAIIVEAVQGEGGVFPAEQNFLQGIRDLCTKHDIMMICDEVQCGMGRTGKMFAYEHYGIKPDIVTMAKGIGSGIPVGAIATTKEIGKAFVPGDHGTTFGGNPFACTAVAKSIELMEKRNLLGHVKEMGDYLGQKLQELTASCPVAKEVRGLGLLRGLVCDAPIGEICSQALEQGLIVLSAGTDVVRFVPPLIIEKAHIDEMIAKLEPVLQRFSGVPH
ncbi:MAG: aspartate aminotransferase family protein [Eubacterium sp.]|jgi:acetylornithine/N-succinyldiaminopimelate aminotransferase|nr:aspartate aminotransferase family protein [Eubacterium sp.]